MSQDARRRLEELLDREIHIAHLLAESLAAERAALVGNSPDAVHERAAEKINLLHALEKLETERRSLWESPAAAGTGIAAAMAGRWRALMDLIAGCRTANEVNGHIIHVRQSQVRQLIDIVRGGAPTTYGPRGQTNGTALRALARA